jgi:hypothetical protein
MKLHVGLRLVGIAACWYYHQLPGAADLHAPSSSPLLRPGLPASPLPTPAEELLVTRDAVSYFLGPDGKPCRKTSLTW